MSRRPRLTGKDVFHHVYAWGNDRHPIFKAEEHYEKYLQWLEAYSFRFCVDVIAYGLMAWHIHLFLLDRLGRLSDFMRALHGSYAQYFNRTVKKVGHAFGERFNSRVVSGTEDAVWLSRYIHRQAVDAGIVKHPRDYRWTSFRAYVGLAAAGFLRTDIILGQFGSGVSACEQYEDFVVTKRESPVGWIDLAKRAPSGRKSQNTLVLEPERPPDTGSVVDSVAARLGTSPLILGNPVGREERRLRHDAFRLVVREYGLSASEVARMFGVSHTAVSKALKQ